MPEEEVKLSHRSRKRVREVKRKARPGNLNYKSIPCTFLIFHKNFKIRRTWRKRCLGCIKIY